MTRIKVGPNDEGQKFLPSDRRVRAFLALFPDPEAIDRIAEEQSFFRGLPSRVKWEPRAHFHVTMKFLGDTTRETVTMIEKELRSLKGLSAPFEGMFDRVGCFPDLRDPRIVWIGFTRAAEEFFLLQNRIESVCSSHGFEKERKRFHPHITIGRVKGSAGREELVEAVREARFDPIAARFSRISLMQSVLQPSGAVYTELGAVPLHE